jgi:transposase
MATPGEVYRDLGGDYFTRRDDPDRRRNRLVAQLASLGYDVALTPAS